jgi:hypothetical protein
MYSPNIFKILAEAEAEVEPEVENESIKREAV